MKILAPAKINLFLEVLGRRPDGYHEIATLFAKIRLFDELEVRLDGNRTMLELDNRSGGEVPPGRDNLAVRAAESFRKAFRLGSGVRIRLVKRIPVGAGLGGGSSDAAAVLAALTRLTGLIRGTRDQRRFLSIAKALGADVPFFVQPSPFALGRGIGEKLQPIGPPRRDKLPWVVLLCPRAHVSTASVYGRLQVPPTEAALTRLSSLDKLVLKLEEGSPLPEWEGLLFNRLEDVVSASHPEIRKARRLLSSLGARGVLMTGSGSSVFGFVPARRQGDGLVRRLVDFPGQAHVVRFLI